MLLGCGRNQSAWRKPHTDIGKMLILCDILYKIHIYFNCLSEDCWCLWNRNVSHYPWLRWEAACWVFIFCVCLIYSDMRTVNLQQSGVCFSLYWGSYSLHCICTAVVLYFFRELYWVFCYYWLWTAPGLCLRSGNRVLQWKNNLFTII